MRMIKDPLRRRGGGPLQNRFLNGSMDDFFLHFFCLLTVWELRKCGVGVLYVCLAGFGLLWLDEYVSENVNENQ